MNIGQEFIEILVAFGGGKGGEPGAVAVRFLLPTLFWAVLVFVSFRQWRREHNGQHLAIAVAALIGMARELLMFAAEYGGLHGWLDFNALYRIYPPLEHAGTMLSSVIIAFAFMNYRLTWQRFSRGYLAAASIITLLLYAATAITWPAFLDSHPRISFGLFWGDMTFRICACSLMGLALAAVLYGRRIGAKTSIALITGITFLFLDEFLMILNLLTRELYVDIFAPIRHNLHIWAVPLFLGVYWSDLKYALREALVENRESLSKTEEARESLSVTLRSIGDAVIVTDVRGMVTLINKVAEQLTGWTSQNAVGRPLAEVFPIINDKTREACVNPVEKVIASGAICGLANHTALIKKDGTEIIIEDSAAPIRDRESMIIGVVLVFRDSTAKHRMEEELGKMEKLQSVGLLAGGIAHDFNNMLTAILGNISIARKHSDKAGLAYARLEEAEKASRRATELTHQLLTFSKGGAPIKKASSLVGIVKECADFTLSGKNVAIDYKISDNLWNVAIDPGQISQVFNNLIINAVHAMPNGGVITCAMSNAVLGENELPLLRAGTYVKIAIQDTGMGIPPEHISRVFEPYFTTKQMGSGLGLASTFSIIRRHDGHITVSSKPGLGTEFIITLPATQQKLSGDTSARERVACGQGRILVMDDEQAVRNVAGEILTDLGYTVAFAAHGREAVSLYEQALKDNQRFAAVIMDLTIPGGMGGQEAMSRLRSIDPAITAFVSSGYSNDPVMAEYAQHGFAGVIVKPYSIDEISKTLGNTLKSPEPGIGTIQ